VWAEGQGVVDYAVFRALGEARRTSWPSWEAPWRDGSVRITRLADVPVGDGGVDLARVHTHLYAQWAMDHQLAELGAGKVQLYLDLPVGVNADAYEVWRDRELFLLGASTGAPPDSLFLGGQSWGLPPLHPEVVRRRGYQYVIDCVRHHMRHAGMLRVDHVMGLFRLFAVPAGFGATEGVYLRYQADELMAILTLESNRHRCALVGEDLGTVPDQVRPAMARHGLARLHVGQFSMPGAVGQPTIAAVPEAIASLNTHDTPTFGGWWRGTDIDDRRALGLITDAQVVTERAERAASKAALVAFVDRGKLAPTSLPDEARAALGATVDLARGPAEVVLVNLEDLWLEPSPQNVPGTSDERPNWRRPFAQDPLAAGADLSVLDAVAAVRPTR
jgi:4-alpha-glucanotransferase